MTCALSWFTPHKVPHVCVRPADHEGIHSCGCGEGLWPHEVAPPCQWCGQPLRKNAPCPCTHIAGQASR